MGNGTSAGQGNYTTYGLRDVERATEQGQHWPPELAEAFAVLGRPKPPQ